MSNPFDPTRSVRTREDFIAFVRDLMQDLVVGSATWQNLALEDYLESLGSWLEIAPDLYRRQGREFPARPDWQTLADMLCAAAMYE